MKGCLEIFRSIAALIIILVLVTLSCVKALAATVDVYGEGEYTQDNIILSVYADINSENLISYGVKVIYNPDELSVVKAEKNESVWYFGNESIKHPYVDPDTSTPGEVVIIGGKLNIDAPTAGVSGKKVLLGKVNFNRKTDSLPTIALSLGKSNNYKNFVTTSNSVLDDLSGAVNFGAVTLTSGPPATPAVTPNQESDTGGAKSSDSNLCFITTVFEK